MWADTLNWSTLNKQGRDPAEREMTSERVKSKDGDMTLCVCTCVCARVDTCGQLKTGALVSHCELLLSASQTVNDANLTARY